MWTFLSITVLTLLGAISPQVDVETSDGVRHAGTVSAFSSGQLTLDTTEKTLTLSIDKLQSIQAHEKPRVDKKLVQVWIAMSDGSRLAAAAYEVAEGRAFVTLPEGERVEVSADSIQSVRFKVQDEDQAKEWNRILKSDTSGDVIVLRKGTRIDFLEGVVREVSDKSVEFQLDGDWIPVGRSKVEGVVYFHARGAKLDASVATIVDAYGSKIEATEIGSSEGALTVTTPAGAELTLPWNSVESIDLATAKFTYLADLKPLSVEWTPYFPSENISEALRKQYLPRMNRAMGASSSGHAKLLLRHYSSEGRVDVNSYTQGIAFASRTKMEFTLPEGSQRFKAIAGIDHRMADLGHVHLVIRGDDKVLFEGDISGRKSPEPLDLSVEGVRDLTILVDFGENMDVGDHLNLCNARIVK